MPNQKVIVALREMDLCSYATMADKKYFNHRKTPLSLKALYHIAPPIATGASLLTARGQVFRIYSSVHCFPYSAGV